MSSHPAHYTRLLRRQFGDDPPLTCLERRELDLHLLLCIQCRYDRAVSYESQSPDHAVALLRDLQDSLTPDSVTPYLRDLARAMRAGRDLDGFQQMMWQFARRDPETLGRFRLLEADVLLRGG